MVSILKMIFKMEQNKIILEDLVITKAETRNDHKKTFLRG